MVVSQKTLEGNLSFTQFPNGKSRDEIIVIELEISLDEINSKYELAEERIYDLEDRSVDMI